MRTRVQVPDTVCHENLYVPECGARDFVQMDQAVRFVDINYDTKPDLATSVVVDMIEVSDVGVPESRGECEFIVGQGGTTNQSL